VAWSLLLLLQLPPPVGGPGRRLMSGQLLMAGGVGSARDHTAALPSGRWLAAGPAAHHARAFSLTTVTRVWQMQVGARGLWMACARAQQLDLIVERLVEGEGVGRG
jgi:hypothetical protein